MTRPRRTPGGLGAVLAIACACSGGGAGPGTTRLPWPDGPPPVVGLDASPPPVCPDLGATPPPADGGPDVSLPEQSPRPTSCEVDDWADYDVCESHHLDDVQCDECLIDPCNCHPSDPCRWADDGICYCPEAAWDRRDCGCL